MDGCGDDRGLVWSRHPVLHRTTILSEINKLIIVSGDSIHSSSQVLFLSITMFNAKFQPSLASCDGIMSFVMSSHKKLSLIAFFFFSPVSMLILHKGCLLIPASCLSDCLITFDFCVFKAMSTLSWKWRIPYILQSMKYYCIVYAHLLTRLLWVWFCFRMVTKLKKMYLRSRVDPA